MVKSIKVTAIVFTVLFIAASFVSAMFKQINPMICDMILAGLFFSIYTVFKKA